MLSYLLAAVVAVGPLLDPLDGEVLTPQDRDVLPAARHAAAVADMWLAPLVNMQTAGSGGIEMFDRPWVSAHGRAASQLHYSINNLDITDPAVPGTPLIDIPQLAWVSLRHASLWTAAPGFAWRLQPAPDNEVRLQGLGGGALGGGMWLPTHLFDRDPSYPYGAPRARRALSAREGVASVNIAGDWGALTIFAERLEHRHTYPTLLGASGDVLPEHADRTTALALASTKVGTWPLQLVAGWQGRERDQEGAQYRFPAALTASRSGDAVLAQVTSERRLDVGRLELGAGWGWRNEQDAAHGEGPQVTDLTGEWFWQARPTPPMHLERNKAYARVGLQLGENDAGWQIDVSGSFARLTRQAPPLGGRTGMTVTDATGDVQPSSQTVWTIPGAATETLAGWRAGAEWSARFAPIDVRLTGAVDWAGVGTTAPGALSFWTPAVGAAATMALGDGQVFILARRDAEALTAHAAAFLDNREPSGKRYAWHDNGNGVPEAGEEGALLARLGGAYHDKAAGLKRPTGNQIALGYKTPSLGPFRFIFAGVARALLDRFTVDYGANTAFTDVAVHDPGGDGRGEARIPGGGQNLTAHAQDPTTLGQETYILRNSTSADYYLGLEMDLASTADTWWFVNLGAAAYLSAGGAPFGSFPDRNDPGAIDEASAGPNNAVNAFGRYDHDRAFAVKLLAGVLPFSGFSVAVAARYRDGQPFNRLLVVPGLPQGPVLLMPTGRGESRFTFNMTWDVRVRYARQLGAFDASVWADIFNVFGSATELLEDPRTGATFRRALEAVPGRAGLLGLEIAWR